MAKKSTRKPAARSKPAKAVKPSKKVVKSAKPAARVAPAPRKAKPATSKGAATTRKSAAKPAVQRPSSTAAAIPAEKSQPSGFRPTYAVHPGVVMMMKWAGDLPERTGRSLDQWVALVKKDGPAGFKERVAWLRTKHALGNNAAWWITERADGKGGEDLDPKLYLQAAEQYVSEQYAGKKSALRPLYDRLLEVSLSLGNDVSASPCKTTVPIYRRHIIAQIKPASVSRIDFGLALGETRASGRLIDTGGFAKKDRITHRIEITSAADIDSFVTGWLKSAYDRNAG